jgi:hypothetical protein
MFTNKKIALRKVLLELDVDLFFALRMKYSNKKLPPPPPVMRPSENSWLG